MIYLELAIIFSQLYIFSHLYKNKINIVSLNCLLWAFLLVINRIYFPADFNGEFYIVIGVSCFNLFHILGRHLSLTEQSNDGFWISYNKDDLFKVILLFSIFEIIRVILIYREVMSLAKSFAYFLAQNTAVRNLYLERKTPFVMKVLMNVVNYFSYVGVILIALYNGQEYDKKKKIMQEG